VWLGVTPSRVLGPASLFKAHYLAGYARHIGIRDIKFCEGHAAMQGGAACAGAAHRGVCARAAVPRRARAAAAAGRQRARGAAAAALAAARHDARRRAGQPGAPQGACVHCIMLVCAIRKRRNSPHVWTRGQ